MGEVAAVAQVLELCHRRLYPVFASDRQRHRLRRLE